MSSQRNVCVWGKELGLLFYASQLSVSLSYLSKAVHNIYTVSCLCFIPSPCFILSLWFLVPILYLVHVLYPVHSPWSAVRSPQSSFYTDRILIILVMLVILVIQVITIFLEITIAPYQCCQSYLKTSKICSKVAIKMSSRGTICYMNNNYYNQPSILVIPLKRHLQESWKKFCLQWIMKGLVLTICWFL